MCFIAYEFQEEACDIYSCFNLSDVLIYVSTSREKWIYRWRCLWSCVYAYISTYRCIYICLNVNPSLEYLYICECIRLAASCGIEVLVGWAGGDGEQGKIEGKERVPQACPGSDGSPDNLLCNGLPLSLSAVKLQAGTLQLRTQRRQTAF